MAREDNNKEVQVIWLIVAQFIVILLLIAAAIVAKDDVTTRSVFIGIAASLGAWLFTDWLRKRFDKSFRNHDQNTARILNSAKLLENKLQEWLDISFNGHDQKVTTIYNVVTGEYLSLKNRDRSKITSKHYEEYYQNANELKISGIALKGFSNYLIDKNSQVNPKHIFNHIKTRPINVKLLFVHPHAPLVKQREKDGDVEGDIMKTINNFEQLYTKIKESNISCIGSLEVKLTTNCIYSSLFHAKENNGSDIMLMGMLFYHTRGDESPLYQVPKDKHSDKDLYTFCENNFKFLFHDATTLFLWRGDSLSWNKKWETGGNPK
jgi:hypothetical protein